MAIVRIDAIFDDSSRTQLWPVVTVTPPAPKGPTNLTATARQANFTGRIGVNLGAHADYSTDFLFADMVKQGRFGSAAAPYDRSVTLKANGWPTGDFGMVLATVNSPAGVYTATFTGTATLSLFSTAASISGPTTSGGVTTYTITVGTGGTPSFMIKVTGKSGFGDDLKVMRPGHTASDIFSHEFLTAVAPFSTIRLMDPFVTNANLMTSWSQRTPANWPNFPNDKVNSNPFGGACLGIPLNYESAFSLANVSGKDIWITLPCLADDDFFTQFAHLAASLLPSGRKMYVELGNEMWNSGFGTFKAFGDAGTAAGFTNRVEYYGERVAKMSQKISAVMPGDSRVRIVYGSQNGNSYNAYKGLAYIATHYGVPSTLIYGLAIAPYFICDSSIRDKPGATADDILAGLSGWCENQGYAKTLSNWACADQYGLHKLLYEDGQDLGVNSANLSAKVASQSDPRIKEIVRRHVVGQFSIGAELVNQYTLSGGWNVNGYWGLTNNITDLTEPKYVGLSALATTATTPVQLNWANNSATATGYRVERKTGGGSYAPLTVMYGPSSSYTDTNAAPSTTYTYRVIALIGTTDSDPSNEITVTTPALPTTPTVPVTPTPPAPQATPTGLTATAVSTSQINLTWVDHATSETGYKVERQKASQGWNVLTTLAPGSTSYNDTTVAANTTYAYRVTATGDADSAVSNAATATTPAAAGTPPGTSWGIVANDTEKLATVTAAMKRIKLDGGNYLRIWTSNFSSLSSGNVNLINEAYLQGIKVIIVIQPKDGGTFNLGTPDIIGFVAKNKTALLKCEYVEVGNEWNLAKYRPDDCGGSSWHGDYVNRFLKPLYQQLHAIGVKVLCVPITDTYTRPNYAANYDALLAAGANSYCDGIAIHYYAVPAGLSDIPGIASHLTSTWGAKPVIVTEANIQFTGLSVSTWQTQITPYMAALRNSGWVPIYYRGCERGGNGADFVSAFDVNGVAKPNTYPNLLAAIK